MDGFEGVSRVRVVGPRFENQVRVEEAEGSEDDGEDGLEEVRSIDGGFG